MSTSTKLISCFHNITSSIQTSILQNHNYMPRTLTNYQQIRNRRRTCKPPAHFVKKRVGISSKLELTDDNKRFLDCYSIDHFANGQSPLKDSPWPSNEYQKTTIRCGVLALKIGVIPQWDKDGKRFLTTMLQVLDNHVIRYIPPETFQNYKSFKPGWKTNDRIKYGSIVVGALSCDPGLFTKDYNNLFTEAGVPPKRKLTRFLVTPDAAIQPGTPLLARHFKVGSYVDVQSKSIGHGFEGVVKRWGMKGGPASHGATKWHRRIGSVGAGRTKSGIWKGKHMPGHMGMDWRHLKGLKIHRINTEHNVLYVHGQAIPGPNHCYVRIMDSVLHNRRDQMLNKDPAMPTFYEQNDDILSNDIKDANLFDLSSPTLEYEDIEKTSVKPPRASKNKK